MFLLSHLHVWIDCVRYWVYMIIIMRKVLFIEVFTITLLCNWLIKIININYYYQYRARLISRSSICSDNHREREKFWSDTKLQACQPNWEWKLEKPKYWNTWAVSCAHSRTKDKDRFKLHEINIMKTTFYINMQILKLTINTSLQLVHEHMEYNHQNIMYQHSELDNKSFPRNAWA